MSRAFIARPPSAMETARIRLAMSVFKDGSGYQREGDSTLPGWRDFERIVAMVFGGKCSENKHVFDVLIQDEETEVDYGYSIKSKQLDRRSAPEDLSVGGRVYIELSNSPAKLWAPLNAQGISEANFEQRTCADLIGASILDTVQSWHTSTAVHHQSQHGRPLDLRQSVFLVISFNKASADGRRKYQLHSFDLDFPKGIEWYFNSAKCLRGEHPNSPGQPLFDWYGRSGGQLKYYPRGADSRFSGEIFELLTPAQLPLELKIELNWPLEWRSAGGPSSANKQFMISQLSKLALMSQDEEVKAILGAALKRLQS